MYTLKQRQEEEDEEPINQVSINVLLMSNEIITINFNKAVNAQQIRRVETL